jgi:hypothetical protein
VPATYADTTDLQKVIGFHPATPLKLGLGKFASWYLSLGPIQVSKSARQNARSCPKQSKAKVYWFHSSFVIMRRY